LHLWGKAVDEANPCWLETNMGGKPLHKIGEDTRGETHVFDMDRTGQFIEA